MLITQVLMCTQGAIKEGGVSRCEGGKTDERCCSNGKNRGEAQAMEHQLVKQTADIPNMMEH